MPPALSSYTPESRWRRAAPRVRTARRYWCVANARGEHTACSLRSATALPAAQGCAVRSHYMPQQARHDRAARPHSAGRSRRGAIARDVHAACRPHSAVTLPPALLAEVAGGPLAAKLPHCASRIRTMNTLRLCVVRALQLPYQPRW